MQTIELAPPIVKDPALEKQKEAKPAQIRALTGIRFLPLALICFHHAHVRWTTLNGHFEGLSYKHFVAMFFVLSGFILTYRYSYVKDVGTSMHFYLARLARLWPMHIFCLFLLLTILPEVFQAKGSMLPVFACNFLMVQSWVPISKYYFSYNAPSWSSATLSFFDVAFPFLFIIGQRSRAVILAGTAALVVTMICLGNVLHLPLMDPNSPSVHGLVYINPLARLLEFAAGVAAALSYKKIAHKVNISPLTGTILEFLALGLVLYVNLFSKGWKDAVTPYITEAGGQWLAQGGVAFIPFAILITVLAIEKGIISKLFATKWMGVLGDMSFALYMLHAPFTAYFSIHFHDEYTTFPSVIFFFASMFVSAHIMHKSIVQPMREQFLKQGTKLLELKWPAPFRKATKKPKAPEKVIRQRWMLAGEIILAGVLFYFAMPTIDRITSAQAETIGASAPVHNVQFGQWLNCKSGSAKFAANEVAVNTVWQATRSQSVDFYIYAKALDPDGNVIGESRYSMDGRLQRVSPGALWSDTVRIPLVVPNERPVTVTVKLTRGKKKALEARSDLLSQVDHAQMIVPVTQLNTK